MSVDVDVDVNVDIDVDVDSRIFLAFNFHEAISLTLDNAHCLFPNMCSSSARGSPFQQLVARSMIITSTLTCI